MILLEVSAVAVGFHLFFFCTIESHIHNLTLNHIRTCIRATPVPLPILVLSSSTLTLYYGQKLTLLQLETL